MSADDETSAGETWPKLLSREEAAKKRDMLLALARENARSDADENYAESDTTDPTLVTFILPGD